jgi:hypothetical protein
MACETLHRVGSLSDAFVRPSSRLRAPARMAPLSCSCRPSSKQTRDEYAASRKSRHTILRPLFLDTSTCLYTWSIFLVQPRPQPDRLLLHRHSGIDLPSVRYIAHRFPHAIRTTQHISAIWILKSPCQDQEVCNVLRIVSWPSHCPTGFHTTQLHRTHSFYLNLYGHNCRSILECS